MRDIFRHEAEAREAEAQQARFAALERAVEGLRNRDRDPEAYVETARRQKALRLYDAAIATFREGINRCPPCALLYRKYTHLLQDLNRTADGIKVARTARLKFPEYFFFKLMEGLLLPMLYSDSDQVEMYRRRFAERLREIVDELQLDTLESRESALEGLKNHVNFLLAYQGRDDRDLQTMYGEMAHHIMAANYPQWVRPLRMPVNDGRLRVGYVSAHMRNHSVSKTHLGWLREHRRRRFQVFGYHVASEADAGTEDARRASDVFRHLPDDLEETCKAILSDRLHILVFLDIGMDPRTTQLAALRLAPIQCTTWGHPMTSGLPTVDYFISSNLMEPEAAQNYYTEKLVCLPGVGICYRKPVIPTVLFYKTRADFGIREDAVVYLSCQSPFKYLPQHDDVFPAIARLVPSAQFVFIGRSDLIRADFQKRLDKVFSGAGVRAADHVIFVPPLSEFNYWNLNVLSDICLDTIEWSGCNSTFAAIACKLPVVTLPGRFMRGRHSYAILTQLGVTETIARDKSGYVNIAARLALDREWRGRVVERLVAGYSSIFADKRSVLALEDFYEQAVSERLLIPGNRNLATTGQPATPELPMAH